MPNSRIRRLHIAYAKDAHSTQELWLKRLQTVSTSNRQQLTVVEARGRGMMEMTKVLAARQSRWRP